MSSKPIAYRQVIEELLEIWDHGRRRSTAHLSIDDRDHRTGIIVRALAAHAADCARGVLTLYRSGQPVPAIPLVRCLMEDAATAMWLYAVDDAWRSFSSEGASNRVKAFRELQKYDPNSFPIGEQLAQLEQIIEQLGPPTGHLVQQRMAAIEGGDNMYLLYRAASAMMHAGVGVVDLYTDADDSAPIGVAARDHAAFTSASAYVGLAASNLLHTLAIWDRCQTDRPDKEALQSVTDLLGLSPSYKPRRIRTGRPSAG